MNLGPVELELLPAAACPGEQQDVAASPSASPLSKSPAHESAAYVADPPPITAPSAPSHARHDTAACQSRDGEAEKLAVSLPPESPGWNARCKECWEERKQLEALLAARVDEGDRDSTAKPDDGDGMERSARCGKIPHD